MNTHIITLTVVGARRRLRDRRRGGCRPGRRDHLTQGPSVTDVVAVVQIAAVNTAPNAGRTVIVDDVPVRTEQVDTPVEVCIARDATRPDGRRVGEAVIRQLARGEMTHVQNQVAASLARAVRLCPTE